MPRVRVEVRAMSDRAEERQTWYFTFGSAHEHPNRFVVFNDRTHDEARALMVAAFGLRWAFQYDERGWLVPVDRSDPNAPRVTQAEKWRLTQLDPSEFPTESPDSTPTSTTAPEAPPSSAPDSARSGSQQGNK